MAPKDPAESAWHAIGALYARPGVAASCLALQDRQGADVVAILYLCHRAAEGGGAVEEGALRAALAAAAPWRAESVLPLRALRRRLKLPPPVPAGTDTESARAAVAQAERAAERALLSILVRALPVGEPKRPAGARLADAAASLAAYLREAGIAAGPAERKRLAAVLAGAFPGEDAAGALRLTLGA